MPSDAEKDYEARLASIVHELGRQKDALKLLGLKQCSCCGKYYLAQDGKNLLDAGPLVCHRCVQDWWRKTSPTLSLKQRQAVEAKLRRWLVSHHNAKVIQQSDKMPPAGQIELKIVVACEQCDGTGKSSSGENCHSCDGRGSVWVVELRPESQ
ncbi:MAG TPA: hypothetical protein VGP19_04545 [Candidatus Acidoferrales bacterium]|jgi:hypothetical protein|nr:hypothetical protein [Candidatus Acidoferrales bacterium]